MQALAQTGVEGLDQVLGGGLTPNRLHLIEGDPGAGKTTLALQFLLAGRHAGERGLYITLSETEEELREGARSHGWDLDGIDIFELKAVEQRALGPEVSLFHPGEIELGEAMKMLLDEVNARDPQRVVFDSLSEIRLLAQQALRYRRQILALKQHFANKKCTVVLLDDRTAEANDRQVMSIAHGALMLQHEAPAYGAERRAVRVAKLRGRKYHGGFHDYTIATGGLRVFPRLIAAEYRRPNVPTNTHEFSGPPSRRGGTAAAPEGPGVWGQSPQRESTANTHEFSGPPSGRGGTAAAPEGPGVWGQSPQRDRVTSGNREFDALLGGGLTRGTSTLISGPPGSGKSSLAAMFAVDAAGRGERSVFYLFDETPMTFLTRSEALGLRVRKHIDDGRLQLQQVDPAELSPGEFVRSVYDAVEAGARLIAIDSLNGYLNAMPQAKFLLVLMHELLTYLSHRNTLTFLVSPQHGVLGMLEPSIDVSYLADTVILTRFFEARGAIHNAISIMKQRSSAHEKTIREFSLGEGGLILGNPLTAFHGVLTGVPQFTGVASDLLQSPSDHERR